MPELPDIEGYLAGLRVRIVGRVVERVSVKSPFVLRSVSPGVEEVEGRRVEEVSRLAKRIVLHLDGDLHLVIHLMVAGRLRWRDGAPAGRGGSEASARRADLPRISLMGMWFENGTLALTEAGTKKRASVHVVGSREGLAAHDPGGIEPMGCSEEELAAALRRENHTLKKALCLPRLIAGIGNAYSDEILHGARLSPLRLTGKLDDAEIGRLHAAMRDVLGRWTEQLRARYVKKFPGAGEVTAFRKEFCAHGKFGQACPACGGRIERIRYADNETNYCPGCQTGGKLLADRSMSRLLKGDWGREGNEGE